MAAVVGKGVEERLEISIVKDGNAIGGMIIGGFNLLLLTYYKIAALAAWEAANS